MVVEVVEDLANNTVLVDCTEDNMMIVMVLVVLVVVVVVVVEAG